MRGKDDGSLEGMAVREVVGGAKEDYAGGVRKRGEEGMRFKHIVSSVEMRMPRDENVFVMPDKQRRRRQTMEGGVCVWHEATLETFE